MHYKILTHDLRSPLQGGEPIFDGVTFPFQLPKVKLDTGPDECAAGWNCCDSLGSALKIAGLWPNGRPSLGFIVEPSSDAIQRGDKTRSSGMTLVRPLNEEEMAAGIRELSQPFGALCDEMVAEQLAWRRALSRPQRDEAAIVNGLKLALKTRGLNWSLLRFDIAVDTRDAWRAWWESNARDAWATRAAWARDARDVRDVIGVRGALARDARGAWDALARDARDARDALIVFSAAREGRTTHDPYRLTLGIRDAYENGLEIAIPVDNSVLGWAGHRTWRKT